MAGGLPASSGGHGAKQTRAKNKKAPGGYLVKVPGARIPKGGGYGGRECEQKQAGLGKQ